MSLALTDELEDFDFTTTGLDAEATVEGDEAGDPPATLLPVTVTAGPFDDRDNFYASVGEIDAEKLRTSAARIKATMNKTLIEVGRELLEISANMPGLFDRWLRLEFAMSKASAYNYINAAKQFGDAPKVVETLPSATVYRLAAKATPDEVRNAIVSEIAAGEAVSAMDVERRIAEAKKRVAEGKRAEAVQEDQARQIAAMERKWDAKAKELADTGKNEKEIEQARKTWDSVRARRERSKQEEREKQDNLNNEYQLERDESKQTARDLVDMLRDNLTADVFEKLRNGVMSLHNQFHLADALKGIEVTPAA